METPPHRRQRTGRQGQAARPTGRTRAGLAAVACLILWRAFPVPARAAADTPRAVVQQTTGAVLAVLADKGLNADQKRRRIERIADAHFDFATLARLVLARNWRRLTPAQQARFVAEFRKHLSLTYGKNLATYHNERIVITGDHSEPGGDWTVGTTVLRPDGPEFRVDYRLRERDGVWRGIDVIIEGVSLVANYRAQFQDIISSDGPAKVISLLRQKNAERGPLRSRAGS